MGMKPRVQPFACWLCFDTGTVQSFETELSDEVCSCPIGRQPALVLDDQPREIKYPSSGGGR